MIKTLGLTTIVLSALLLSGCGGSKKNTTENIKEKDVILIFHDVYNGNCQKKEDELKNRLEGMQKEGLRAKDVTVDTVTQNVNCTTYGRSNDGLTCTEETLGQGTETCVITYNISQNKNLKQMGNENVSDLAEIISSELL